MIIDVWYAITLAGFALTAIGGLRLIKDEYRADATDGLTMILAFGLISIAAATAANLEQWGCTSTTCQYYIYYGMQVFTYPLYAVAMIDLGLFFAAIVKSFQLKGLKDANAIPTGYANE